MKQVLARVKEKTELNPGTFYITVKAPEIAAIASPGQFVMIHCGENLLAQR